MHAYIHKYIHTYIRSIFIHSFRSLSYDRSTASKERVLHRLLSSASSFSFHCPSPPPQWAATAPLGSGPPHYRGFTITFRHSTLGRTPLDEWSACRRDLYLATHNTYQRRTSMLSAGFKTTISAGERPQAHALDSAAVGLGLQWLNTYKIIVSNYFLRLCQSGPFLWGNDVWWLSFERSKTDFFHIPPN
jgi:hypothetical protein